MKLEIELDLNKIDYDAINKQIQEKIAEMDLADKYNFGYTIKNKINDEVEQCVTQFLKTRKWGDLNESSRLEMRSMLYSRAREILDPHVGDIINKIPEEEMNQIVMDLIPKVLIDILSENLKNTLYNCYGQARNEIVDLAASRIRNSIG